LNKVRKATINCRSFFIAGFFLGVSFVGFTQETTMYHFQRKATLDQVIFPGEKFNSSNFIISFPDSLYTAGQVTIKKARIKEWKLQANFVFSDNAYTTLTYVVKKKNRDEFIQLIEKAPASFEWKVKKKGRKYVITLTALGSGTIEQ
jgi:hypothetical protein